MKTICSIMLVAVALVATACGSSSPDEPTPGTNPGGGSSSQLPAATSDVIYEVNPRFYGDKDCLKALTADIPRIKSMNVNILWIMPPFELGIEKSVGSPYCVKDYEKIDPKLGSLDDFKTLVETAHANGIRVILDWVANHTSFDNVWTKTHPERYVHDANGNIAATPQWSDVAELDYNQASTREAMIDAMSYWVINTRIDGYRCDHTDGVPHDFWKQAIKELKLLDYDIFMLAESNDTEFFNDGFYMVYDWNFPSAVIAMLNGGTSTKFFDYVQSRNAQIPADKGLLRYAFNHDVAAENSVNTYFKSQDGTILAYLLAAFTGETPMLYSSMDVESLSGKISFFSNAHRTLKFSDRLTRIYGAINDAYIKSADARGGTMRQYASQDAVMIGFQNGDKKLLIVANPSASERTVKMPIALTGEKMTDLINGGNYTVSTTTQLPAYGYMILAN